MTVKHEKIVKCPKGHKEIQMSGERGVGAVSETGMPALTGYSYYCFICKETYDSQECIKE